MEKKGLFATKPIADYQAEAAGKHLVRALGIPALIAFCLLYTSPSPRD